MIIGVIGVVPVILFLVVVGVALWLLHGKMHPTLEMFRHLQGENNKADRKRSSSDPQGER